MTKIVEIKKGVYGDTVIFLCDHCGRQNENRLSDFNRNQTHYCDVGCYAASRVGKKREFKVESGRKVTRWHDAEIEPYAWMLKYNTMKLR